MSRDATEIYDVVPVFAVDESGKALITEEQYSWLCNYAVRKAEQVQELEKDVKEWKVVNESWEQINTQIVEQNKRYREALEFYADERNYKERDFGMIIQPAIQDGDKGKTARKALEGEE